MKLPIRMWRLIQFAFTVFLIWLLLSRVQWNEFQSLAAELHWGVIALAAWVLLIGHALNILRWRILVQSHEVSYNRLLVYYCASLFANNFLPTGIGGDGVRVALLSRDVSLARAAFSVGLDRASGLASFSAILVVGWLLGVPPSLRLDGLTSNNTVAAIGVLASVIAIGVVGVRFFLRFPRAVHWRARFTNYSRNANWPALLGGTCALSFVANMGIVVSNWFVIQAVGLQVPFPAAIWMFLAIWLSFLLPIAVNGLGLVEGGIVAVLALYGVPTTMALGAALINRGLMVGISLLGGLVSLKWRPHESLKRSS